MVILIPVLLALPFLGIQAALLHHARSVAVTAASEGARTAAAELGTEADGAAAASAYLAAVGDRALLDSSVSVTRTATTARAVVTGESLSVIPLWTARITQQSTASVERLTTRTDP